MYRAYVENTWIGVLYGTTTFFPVSRGGHLVLTELIFEANRVESGVRLLYLGGIVVATILLMWGSLVRIGFAAVTALRHPTTLLTTHGGRDLSTVLIAQLPILLVATVIGVEVDPISYRPMLSAIGFFLTALTLLSTAWAGGSKELHPTLVQSVLLGFGQVLEGFPGLSAPACTIAMGMWFGLSTRRSFELAMLVSLPAALLTMARLCGAHYRVDQPIEVLVVAFIGSLASSLVASRVLRWAVSRGLFAWFSMWVAPLAIATFAFACAWPRQ